jgi:hypothetical protein
LAGRRITAWIISTAGFTTTVTLFALLYDSVAALLACDERYVSVLAEAVCADAVAANGGANVAY